MGFYILRVKSQRGNMKKKSFKVNYNKVANIVWKIFRAALIFGLCFIILYPLIYMISVAFRPAKELYDPIVIWIPKTIILENIIEVFNLMDYPQAVQNTLRVNVVSTVVQIVSCALVGYGFAKFEFPGKKIMFALVIFTIIVPPQTVIIPLYMQYRFFDFLGAGKIIELFVNKPVNINLLDSPWTFYVEAALGSGIRSGLFIYIFRQFFRGIPKELEEAAYIDGCGIFSTFARIMIPNAGPAILSTSLFSLVWYWNDYFKSAMYFTNFQTVSLALSRLNSSLSLSGTDQYVNVFSIVTKMQAGCILAILPMLILYIFLQKYFTESIERTGIVG